VAGDAERAVSSVESAAQVAALTRDVLARLLRPELAFALAHWPYGARQASAGSATLPVLRWLPELARTAPAFSAKLVASLSHARCALAWRQSYTKPEVSESFLENYGWSELVGPRGPFPCSAFACGFLLLGPRTHYPSHYHEAQELYVPLAGVSSWQSGGQPWQTQHPGAMIVHASNEPHAMQTAETALLAVYVWRSCDLLQTARLGSDA
jgi:Dimethlysulfonioproprionate lyase